MYVSSEIHNSPQYFLFFFKIYIFIFFSKILFIYFIERDEGREKVGEKYQCVVTSHVAPTGEHWLTTQACALTANATIDSLIHRLALNPLCHSSQAKICRFLHSVSRRLL